MLKRLPKPLQQAGDTIVEVMIVLAVLGLAIGISYATADDSLKATRQAQDASQATDVLQSQIEALRSLSQSTAPTIYNAQPFCMALSPVSIVTTPSGCSNIDNLYTVAITYASAQDTFTAVATWPDAAGQGTDSSTLVYRVHKLQ